MSSPKINGRFIQASLVTLFCTVIAASLVIICAYLKFSQKRLDSISRWWARSILDASGIKTHFTGLEYLPEGPAVLAGNHQGVFEILALIAFLPRSAVFVGKQEAFKIPLFGQGMLAIGHIPVDRKNHEKAVANIQAGAKRLKQTGNQVVFFPEGTRTRNGKLQDFKKGAFVFAIESQLPIVPFVVDGSYQALPPKTKVIHPGNVYIEFLPVISSTGLNIEQRDALRDQTREIISLALQKMRSTQEISEDILSTN